MEWLASISTTSALAVILWLSRELIATRLTNAVRHEYDTKLEVLRSTLQVKSSQIEALRRGVLSGATTRQQLIFERQLQAIEELWAVVIALGEAKSVARSLSVFKFDEAIKVAAKDRKLREMFEFIPNVDIGKLPFKQALQARPFLSPVAWAYYSAYQAIILHTLTRAQMLKNGIDMSGAINTPYVADLIKVALPHRANYVDGTGEGAFPYLLDELETMLLTSFQLMLKGEDADKEALKGAAEITRMAERLLEADSTPDEPHSH